VTAPCILVVEDHEPLLNAIRMVLQRAGYTVLTATDGQKGLEVMERVRPDLIVADIMMPNMDGYEFYHAVRARPDGLTIPFIFLTARTTREDILRGKSMGAEDYLTKPFDPEELLVVVRSRLKRAGEIQQAISSEFDQLARGVAAIPGGNPARLRPAELAGAGPADPDPAGYRSGGDGIPPAGSSARELRRSGPADGIPI